jgi:hypothetical protein
VKSKLVAVSPLEAHLGYWLRFVSNQVSHSFSLKLGERGVTVAEWGALQELYEREAMAPSALAERISMTRGAISKLADAHDQRRGSALSSLGNHREGAGAAAEACGTRRRK